MGKTIVTFIVIAILAFGFSAYAIDIYVDAVKGSDLNGGTSKDDAFKTITKALNEVMQLQIRPVSINIAKGTYDISNGEKFPLEMSIDVALIGEDRENTIINASEGISINLKSVIHCEYVNGCSVKNLTLTGGTGTQTCVRPLG
jgi:hypothetical protein